MKESGFIELNHLYLLLILLLINWLLLLFIIINAFL